MFFDEQAYARECRAAEEAARFKLNYAQLRTERPEIPARHVFAYLRGSLDPVASNIDQAICSHEFVVNGETDRCYCCKCGIDGDA